MTMIPMSKIIPPLFIPVDFILSDGKLLKGITGQLEHGIGGRPSTTSDTVIVGLDPKRIYFCDEVVGWQNLEYERKYPDLC